MATKLTKPIVRETVISGEDYIVTLTNSEAFWLSSNEPLVTLRKKGSRGTPLGFPLKDLLEESPKEEAPAHYHDMISYTDIMSKLGGLQSKEAEPLKEIVRDIFEVNVLASDLSDEEVEKKGVALPE